MWCREFIIQLSNSKKRKLIKAFTCAQLLRDACRTFNVASKGSIVVLEDGTEVSDDDYLRTREPLTLLVLLSAGQYDKYLEWRAERVVVQFCEAWTRIRTGSSKQLGSFLQHQRVKEALDLLTLAASKSSGDARLSTCDSRKEHPEWFDGLPKEQKSKKTVMRASGICRIKSYFYKTKDDVRGIPAADLLMDEMRSLMKTDSRNHSSLFVRGEKGSLCSVDGQFACQGPFDMDACSEDHSINPYADRHCRIMFGTWNLDHQIERSRSVVPAIREACAHLPLGKALNAKYFYSLLFTTANLRLVHLVCHKKGRHLGFECKRSSYYTSSAKLRTLSKTEKIS